MKVDFMFALGQKVTMENGGTGRVVSNSISRRSEGNRVLVEYFNTLGDLKTDWVDELDLKTV